MGTDSSGMMMQPTPGMAPNPLQQTGRGQDPGGLSSGKDQATMAQPGMASDIGNGMNPNAPAPGQDLKQTIAMALLKKVTGR